MFEQPTPWKEEVSEMGAEKLGEIKLLKQRLEEIGSMIPDVSDVDKKVAFETKLTAIKTAFGALENTDPSKVDTDTIDLTGEMDKIYSDANDLFEETYTLIEKEKGSIKEEAPV
jgi:hypothetical protein